MDNIKKMVNEILEHAPSFDSLPDQEIKCPICGSKKFDIVATHAVFLYDFDKHESDVRDFDIDTIYCAECRTEITDSELLRVIRFNLW